MDNLDAKDLPIIEAPAKLDVGGVYELPQNLPPGKIIVFGREPRTKDPNAQFFTNEVDVKLEGVDRSVSRRALSLQSILDGGYIVTNLSEQKLTWQVDQNIIPLDPHRGIRLSPGTPVQNLKFNFGSVSLRVQQVEDVQQTQKIRSLTLVKNL